jgi:uncharacterized phiE125 gp8 family phage protein
VNWDRLKRVGVRQSQPVTLAEIKANSRIDHTEDDGLLLSILDEVLSLVEDEFHIMAATQQYALYLDAFGYEIDLPLHPVRSVDSITYESSGTQTVSDTVYEVDLVGGRIRPLSGQSWPSVDSVYNPITVTFTVGETAAPESLRRAILSLVSHYYENAEASAPLKLTEIPYGPERLLQQYKRNRFG